MAAANSALVALLKRDRIVLIFALALLTTLAWAYVLWLSAHMAMSLPAGGQAIGPTGGMAGMDMGTARAGDGVAQTEMGELATQLAPALRIWAPADFGFMFAMWSVMMVGMMTPSVAPMVLLYAAAGRKAAAGGTLLASTGWFFGGYIAVWISFSALATAAQWGLTSLALLTPMMASASTLFGGIVLVVVGLYQWTPLKEKCLVACQTPLVFLMRYGGFRGEAVSALRMGFAHGTYCLGCCFALMAILFVGGIMNILWIAGLTILILAEKLVPGRLIPRISGALIAAVGVWLLTGTIWR